MHRDGERGLGVGEEISRRQDDGGGADTTIGRRDQREGQGRLARVEVKRLVRGIGNGAARRGLSQHHIHHQQQCLVE